MGGCVYVYVFLCVCVCEGYGCVRIYVSVCQCVCVSNFDVWVCVDSFQHFFKINWLNFLVCFSRSLLHCAVSAPVHQGAGAAVQHSAQGGLHSDSGETKNWTKLDNVGKHQMCLMESSPRWFEYFYCNFCYSYCYSYLLLLLLLIIIIIIIIIITLWTVTTMNWQNCTDN